MNKKENKNERFKRLAEKRTRKVLNDIRVLSNLSNKGLYDYTSEQRRKIFGAIRDSLANAEARFKGEQKRETEFNL
ncbi:MAG: hypothetical protein KJ757_07140 [Planctomycetes bacterium]|nr:hypothetical protein [Planctomycetota bacterium]